MAAGVYNLNIEEGATFERVLTIKDSDGNAFNWAGYTARMHIRETIDAEDPPLLALTTENSGIALQAGGNLRILITHTQTAGLDLDADGVYDLELVAPAGSVTRLLKGIVRLDREVTR